MKECTEQNQIRYFGIKKVDPRLVSNAQKTKTTAMTRGKLMVAITKVKIKIKNIDKKILETTDKNEKKELQHELKTLTMEKARLNKLYDEIERKKSQSRGSSKIPKRTKSTKSTKSTKRTKKIKRSTKSKK